MIWVLGAVTLLPALVATWHSCVTVLGAGESAWVVVTGHGDHVLTGRDLLLHHRWAFVRLWGHMTRDLVGVTTGEELRQDDHAGTTALMAELRALVVKAAQGLGTWHPALVTLVLRVIHVAYSGTRVPASWELLSTHLQTPTLRTLG